MNMVSPVQLLAMLATNVELTQAAGFIRRSGGRGHEDAPLYTAQVDVVGNSRVQVQPKIGPWHVRERVGVAYNQHVSTHLVVSASPSTQESSEAVRTLLDTYIERHAMGKQASENGFVVGVYGCPKQLGNRLHEFLNAFAVAVITDRTLVWQYTKQGNVGSLDYCDSLMHRQAWLPSAETIKDEYVHNFNWNYQPARMKEMACAELDDAGPKGHPVINLGVIEQYESFSLAADDAKLSTESKKRAKTLFALGPGFAFGSLSTRAFTLDGSISNSSQHSLQKLGFISGNRNHTAQELSIGMHIRTVGDQSKVSMFQQPLTDTMQTLGDRGCQVLLATDNDAIIDSIRQLVEARKCNLVVSEVDGTETSFSEEHGKHAGVGALRDVDLLSNADVLLLSCGSTFSEVIAEWTLAKNPGAVIQTVGCESEVTKPPQFTMAC
eukprot:TRINITY_DN45861_c0_g1_i1.p1 TRINITY_DN45861_c0_g1~~TRINITY_DN45861_c0_g1_i1.p1  ORF type:complete len:437 (-),score=58.94 TRINITY_DN45861_c0_g1_i1:71-1381(-)